jgi:peptidoglycan/LPS O-acetylase OafA/YrhL
LEDSKLNSAEFKSERIHGPDILRGLAAICVIFFHVLFIEGVPHSNLYAWIAGRFDFFVRIFFMVSAFSMAYVYMNRLNKITQLKPFYIKRFFRIAPLFYLVITFNSLCSYFEYNQLQPLKQIIINLLFLFQLTPGMQDSLVGGGWSIGVEIMFYFLFPSFMILCGNLKSSFVTFITLLIVSLITKEHYTFYLGGAMRSFGALNPLAHLQYFAAGFVIYHVWNNFKLSTKKVTNLAISVLLISLTIALFRVQSIIPEEFFISILGAALVYFSALGLPKVIDNKITRYLGTISYSTYLIQFPIISTLTATGLYNQINMTFGEMLDSGFISSLITILLVILVSSLTFKLIECPCRNYGASIASKINL